MKQKLITLKADYIHEVYNQIEELLENYHIDSFEIVNMDAKTSDWKFKVLVLATPLKEKDNAM